MIICDDWIKRVIQAPEKQEVQADGRIRLWGKVPEMEGRYTALI